MGSSAFYRILVRGSLAPDWSARMAGLKISPSETDEGISNTLLEGPVLDQASLSGVLNALYDLRLPVISVSYVGAEER